MSRFSRRAFVAMLGAAALPLHARPQRSAPALLTLPTADGRLVQVTHWPARRRRGTILFSHGALSAPAKYEAMILPWVSAGFDVYAPLHVDSTDHPQTRSYPGLASWPARIHDMRALAAYVGKGRWVAAGHSYGALVALTLGGASPKRPQGVEGPLADPRVTSVVAFSPPGVDMGLIDRAGYATLAVPALIQTGTLDIFPGRPPTAWRDHLAAYEAPAEGSERYALVLEGADHYFGGLICRPDLPGPRQTAQMDAALKICGLFLDAYGLRQRRARIRLQQMTGPSGLAMLSRK